MIDSHCHLDFSDFDTDRQQVVERCLDNGIAQILIPGTRPQSWSALMTMCNNHPALHYALGIHPWFLDEVTKDDLDTLRCLLQDPDNRPLAVGEIGLDFAIEQDPARQIMFFEAQLALARQAQLPVIVHHRQSHNDVIRILKQASVTHGGVIHAFSGSLQEAETYIELGFMLGVGGTITYPRASKTRATLANVPLDYLLLETDAPDMPMAGRQGQRNSPEYLPQVATELADLQGISPERVDEVTSANFKRLFGL